MLFSKKKNRDCILTQGYKIEYQNISDPPRVRKALIRQIDVTITSEVERYSGV